MLLEIIVENSFWAVLVPAIEALWLVIAVLVAEEAQRREHGELDGLLEGVQSYTVIWTAKQGLIRVPMEGPDLALDDLIVYRLEETLAILLSSSLEDSRTVEKLDDAVPKEWLCKNIVHCDSGGQWFVMGEDLFVRRHLEEPEGRLGAVAHSMPFVETNFFFKKKKKTLCLRYCEFGGAGSGDLNPDG